MKNLKHLAACSILGMAALASFAQDCGCPPLASRTSVDLSTLTDANGNLPAGATTLTCNNTYKLDERVYVPSGGVLNIQAGTVIKGQLAGVDEAYALIVTRGGKINAVGSPTCPIIFTAEADPLDGTYNVANRGLWGGLIILGKAQNNTMTGDPLTVPIADGGANGIAYIEGLNFPDSRHHYGSATPDNNDNSGVLKYVSIRHGGAVVGEGNEINGLTLGSVGKGTTIDYVEIVSNDDDGIEFFGGTVDVKHIAVLFCRDDDFDWDQGYNGRSQYLYSVKHPFYKDLSTGYGSGQTASHTIEADGDDVSGRTPLSNPLFFNMTGIGYKETTNDYDNAIHGKARTNGEVSNSIFAGFKTAVFLNSNTAPYHTSGALKLNSNLLINATTRIAPSTQLTKFDVDNPAGAASLLGMDFVVEINTTTGAVTGKFDAIPASNAVGVVTTYQPPIDGFFEATNYRGAFEPGAKVSWLNGWSLADKAKYELGTVECPTDINSDGVTNITDYSTIVGQFGRTCQ
jgi:hypothetical protein